MRGDSAAKINDLGWLLTSDEGRLPRKPFWLYILTICTIAAGLMLIPAFRRTPLALALFQLALLYPCYCVFAKRLQDLDISGKLAIFIVLIAAGDVLLTTPGLYHVTVSYGLIGQVWRWLSMTNALLLVMLGLLPGTQGPNRFGLAA